MLGFRKETLIRTPRLILRPPRNDDFVSWTQERRASANFLKPWEPVWAADHLTRRSFRNRVAWSRRAIRMGRAWPFFLCDPTTNAVLGAATLDNIRLGPAQAATLGYWIGEAHAGHGLMHEALEHLLPFAFETLGLGRVEAGTLPENKASRALLERSGFKYEGVAQAYLQIDGRWRDHVLYAALRSDRRGRTE